MDLFLQEMKKFRQEEILLAGGGVGICQEKEKAF